MCVVVNVKMDAVVLIVPKTISRRICPPMQTADFQYLFCILFFNFMDYHNLLYGQPASLIPKSLIKSQTCSNLVKHLEKCINTTSAKYTWEGVPFEGTNENSSQPAMLDLFSMHRNLCGQFSPPLLPPPLQKHPTLPCHSLFQPIGYSLKEQVAGATR